MRRLLSVMVLGWLLVACEPLEISPAQIEGQPIVGHWFFSESVQMDNDYLFQRLYVHVREDGRVLYANVLCRQTLSSGARSRSRLVLEYLPIRRISTKKMVLQKYWLTPKFELTLGKWPDESPGVFEVDNLPAQAITADEAPDYASWEC